MKKTIILGLITIAISISGCTFNVSTGANNATAPPSNSTNSAPTLAENKTANTATVPKKEESAPTAKSDSPTSSGNGVRVQFAKGETSTMVTKDIPAKSSVDFLINVKKGQKMGFTVGYDFNDNDVNAALYEPDTKDVTLSSGPKEPQEFEVKMNGDHRLTVNNTTNKKVTITLYLDVE